MSTDYALWSQYLAEWVEYRYGKGIEDRAWEDYAKGLDPYGDPKPEEEPLDGSRDG